MERIACPLCASTAYLPLMTTHDRLLGIAGQFTIVRCTECALHYLNPRPTISELARHYPEDYLPFTTPPPAELPPLKRYSVNYGLHKRRRALLQYKRGGQLLEIGCANGLFLDTMRRVEGWQVQGVEISESAVRSARERLGLEVFHGTLADAHYQDERFDAVVMWDVLEHVHDPQETLREVRRVLKRDGVLLLRLPLLDCWDRRLFGRYWIGWDAPRHLTTFSLRTLQRMLCQTGFGLERAASISGSYPAFALSASLWAEDHLPTRARRTLQKTLDALLVRAAAAPLFWAMDRLTLGTVVTVVAHPVDVQIDPIGQV